MAWQARQVARFIAMAVPLDKDQDNPLLPLLTSVVLDEDEKDELEWADSHAMKYQRQKSYSGGSTAPIQLGTDMHPDPGVRRVEIKPGMSPDEVVEAERAEGYRRALEKNGNGSFERFARGMRFGGPA